MPLSGTSLPGWSFGLGLVSILFGSFVVPPVAAIVLGALGLERISGGAAGSRWMAWTGIVLGILYTVVAFMMWGGFLG